MSRSTFFISGFLTGTSIALLAVQAVTSYDYEAVTPRLQGYGCEGASGTLYANEEDEFPLCTMIEENGT